MALRGLGVFQNIHGTGIDGNVTIATSVTLTRDMHYKNLTLNDGATIIPRGFRIFVRERLTVSGVVFVDNAGYDAAPTYAGSGASYNYFTSTLPYGHSGIAGGAINTAAIDRNPSGRTGLGGNGGAGGAGNLAGTSGDYRGGEKTPLYDMQILILGGLIATRAEDGDDPNSSPDTKLVEVFPGGGGGGGGGGTGRTGGHGGGGGGFTFIAAGEIVVSPGAGWLLSNVGGAGGAGGAGGGSCGGGGGGGGGIVLIWTGRLQVGAGAAIVTYLDGGAGGNGRGTAGIAIPGTGGGGGVYLLYTDEAMVRVDGAAGPSGIVVA